MKEALYGVASNTLGGSVVYYVRWSYQKHNSTIWFLRQHAGLCTIPKVAVLVDRRVFI